jgi:hypothetical protein
MKKILQNPWKKQDKNTSSRFADGVRRFAPPGPEDWKNPS